jgi:arylsulfatase
MHVADIMPTLLEVAQIDYPVANDGKPLPPLLGKSWLNMLQGRTEFVRTNQDYIGWELFGNRAIRQGDWKIRWQWAPFGTGDWELFNLETDPAERTDLARNNPAKLGELLSLWTDYVEKNNVILPDRSVYENLEDQLPKRFPDDPGYPPLIYKKQFVPPQEMVKE